MPSSAERYARGTVILYAVACALITAIALIARTGVGDDYWDSDW